MKERIKYFLIGSITSMTLLGLVFSFLGKEKSKNYYYSLDSFIKKLFIKKSNFNKKDFSSCLPREISFIPQDSSIIIGHAYGRGATELVRDKLSPKVERFLENHRNTINTLFLTGDIFNRPSLERWQNFYSNYEKNFDIFIAPGNHEVQGPYRDLFTLYVGKKQPINFPFSLKRAGFNIVIEDSNFKKTILDSDSDINKFNKFEENTIFLRHHVLIDKLADYGGGGVFTTKKAYEFENRLKNNSNFYFIYGNGGMYADKPRIACYSHRNFTHLLNGIGEFDNDYIIVLSGKEIYKYRLKN